MNADNNSEELQPLQCAPYVFDLPTLGVWVEGRGGGQELTQFTQAPHAGIDITGGLPVHLLHIVHHLHTVHHLHWADLLV